MSDYRRIQTEAPKRQIWVGVLVGVAAGILLALVSAVYTAPSSRSVDILLSTDDYDDRYRSDYRREEYRHAVEHEHNIRHMYSPFYPDPSVLQWKSMVESKTATGLRVLDAVGNLTVPLVHGDADSPTLRLEVRLRRFLDVTDQRSHGHAPAGAILGHCGGPGSDAACGLWLAGEYIVEDDVPMGYDVLGISQRGVKGNEISMRCSAITGRAPTLPAHSSASLAEIAKGCACAHTQGAKAGYMWKDMDTGDEAAVRGVFEESRTHADRCYAAPYWRLDGARNKTYNFLEHVGTQALLYDLELLRSAMGLERLSFYGASYGTGVASSYASTFPERTGRVVLDGNLFPFPNTVSMGLVWTSAVSQVIEHMLNNCRVKSAVCALQRPFRSFEAVLDAARRGELRSPKTADGSRIALNNGLIVGYMHDVAEERGCGWKKAVLTLALLNASDAAHREVGVVQVLDRLCKVGKNITWRRYSSCIDGILVGEDDDAIMGTATLAMDNAGRLNVDSGVGMWRAERKLYGEQILGHSIGYVSSIGTWQVQPKPVAPIGSVDVAPLVVGNLYDQATSYILSQHMAASFPRSSLITYQGLGHCLDQPTDPLNLDPSGTGECTKLVKNYLRTGDLPPKGHTCAMDVPIPVPTVEEVAAAAAVGGAK